MRRFLLPGILCAILVAGCNSGPGAGNTGEAKNPTVMRPTVIINTTKGDIRVVLFPKYLEHDGQFFLDTTEKQYVAFTDGVNDGYYNGAQAFNSPKREFLANYIWFLSQKPDTSYEIDFVPSRNIQPVRGTLCMMQLDSEGRPGAFYADKRRFLIVRNIKTELNGEKIYPMRGQHYPIGQVVEGLNILDSLGENDHIVSITKGPDYEINTLKLEQLGNGEIDNYADVVKK